jgi:hypothetical protein
MLTGLISEALLDGAADGGGACGLDGFLLVRVKT